MPLSCVALILHHDGLERLRPLYDSLRTQDSLTAVCLIDNASRDGSVEFTRREYPEIEILQNEDNVPFGTAYNLAVESRREDVVLLLNDDVILRPDSIRNALGYLQSHADVASVSFESLDPTRASAPFPAPSIPLRRFGKTLSPARNFKDSNDDPIVSPCFLWGAACCIRREVFMRVRFDERMDWYFEDVDLGWAITRQTGMLNVFVPSASVFHQVSATSIDRFGARRIRLMTRRNAVLSFAKNGSFGDLVKALPYVAFSFILVKQRTRLALDVLDILRARMNENQ